MTALQERAQRAMAGGKDTAFDAALDYDGYSLTDQEKELQHSEQSVRRKRRENVAAMLAEMKGTDREIEQVVLSTHFQTSPFSSSNLSFFNPLFCSSAP